jgi:PII-like signaling protein
LLAPGRATKVTIHLNEDVASEHDFLPNEIFSFLYEQGIAGATVLRPQAGFGSHHRVHATVGEPAVRQHLPVRIEFVEESEKVSRLLPSLCDLVTDGLIEAHDTVIIKAAARKDSL